MSQENQMNVLPVDPGHLPPQAQLVIQGPTTRSKSKGPLPSLVATPQILDTNREDIASPLSLPILGNSDILTQEDSETEPSSLSSPSGFPPAQIGEDTLLGSDDPDPTTQSPDTEVLFKGAPRWPEAFVQPPTNIDTSHDTSPMPLTAEPPTALRNLPSTITPPPPSAPSPATQLPNPSHSESFSLAELMQAMSVVMDKKMATQSASLKEDITSINRNMATQSDSFKEELSAMASKTDKLATSMAAQNTKSDTLATNMREDMSSLNKKLDTSLASMKDDMSSLNKKLDTSLASMKDDMTTQNKKMDTSLASLKEDLSSMATKVDVLAINNKISSIEEKFYSALSSKCQVLTSRMDEELLRVSSEINSGQLNLTEFKTITDKSLAAADKKLSVVQQQLEEKTVEINNVLEQFSDTQFNLTKLEQKQITQTKEIEALTKELVQTQETILTTLNNEHTEIKRSMTEQINSTINPQLKTITEDLAKQLGEQTRQQILTFKKTIDDKTSATDVLNIIQNVQTHPLTLELSRTSQENYSRDKPNFDAYQTSPKIPFNRFDESPEKGSADSSIREKEVQTTRSAIGPTLHTNNGGLEPLKHLIKGIPMPTFSALREEAAPLFMSQLKDYLIKLQVPPDRWLEAIPLPFKGTASQWWSNVKTTVTTWDQFERIFLTTFFDFATQSRYQRQLSRRVQRETDSIETFIYDTDQLFKLAHPFLKVEERLEQIICKLHPRYQNALCNLASQLKSVQDLASQAKRMQNMNTDYYIISDSNPPHPNKNNYCPQSSGYNPSLPSKPPFVPRQNQNQSNWYPPKASNQQTSYQPPNNFKGGGNPYQIPSSTPLHFISSCVPNAFVTDGGEGWDWQTEEDVFTVYPPYNVNGPGQGKGKNKGGYKAYNNYTGPYDHNPNPPPPQDSSNPSRPPLHQPQGSLDPSSKSYQPKGANPPSASNQLLPYPQSQGSPTGTMPIGLNSSGRR